jgi:hypothetical protein
MKPSFSWAAMVIAAFPFARAESQAHPFSVKDDIGMVRFSYPLPEPGLPGSEIALPSPDGKHVAVVTTKGLLASDRIRSEISIFKPGEVSRFLENTKRPPPKPRVIAAIESFPHREGTDAYAPVISDLQWSPDGMSLYFKGENANGAYQLYKAKLDGTGYRSLTPPNLSVGRFDIRKGVIVYTASRPVPDAEAEGDEINPDARDATGHLLGDILFPNQRDTVRPETFSMYVLHADAGHFSTSRVPNYALREIPYLSHFFPFSLSPKSTRVIGLNPISSVPDAWGHYEPVDGFEDMRLTTRGDPRLTKVDNILRPQQYAVIDLTSGKTVPLLNAPNARSLGYYLDSSRLAWAADERRVLVTNTFLPLDQGAGLDVGKRRGPCSVASVDLPSLHARCLFYARTVTDPNGQHVQDVTFEGDNDGAKVLLKGGSSGQTIQRFHLQGEEWVMVSTSHSEGIAETFANRKKQTDRQVDDSQIFIKQSLNDPPTLWASDRKTGKSSQLWDPNPQFDQVRFGTASDYSWKDKTGREWSGVLVKPVDYVSGKKYPLVLQMYTFADGQFMTDGLAPTAFAARHLASSGFMVLQIKKKPSKVSEADPQDHLEGYRSAVDSLDEAGLIDRRRVGVVGFSWTCWYAVNALTKEPNLFAAATIADGLDNSYMQYMLFGVASYPLQKQMEAIRGASPFGDGLQQWIKDAPEFHLDRVTAPVRIEAIGPTSVLQEWELYSSLRMQNKPVDLIYFPHGTHIHQKPLERLESQQGDVDWFRFWLQGFEDPDPSKRFQYERWRKLKSGLGRDPISAAIH